MFIAIALGTGLISFRSLFALINPNKDIKFRRFADRASQYIYLNN